MTLEEKHKEWLYGLAGVVVVLGVILGVVLVTNTSQEKMKPVNYSNGEGANFNVVFYTKHAARKVFGSAAAAGNGNPNLIGLYAKEGLDGKLPLSMFISSSKMSDANKTAYNKYKNCEGMTTAQVIHNDYLNADLHLCAVEKNKLDLIYLAVFKQGSMFYVVNFNQDIDFQKAENNKDLEKALMSRAGLSVYKYDIQKIVASIQIVKTTPKST